MEIFTGHVRRPRTGTQSASPTGVSSTDTRATIPDGVATVGVPSGRMILIACVVTFTRGMLPSFLGLRLVYVLVYIEALTVSDIFERPTNVFSDSVETGYSDAITVVRIGVNVHPVGFSLSRQIAIV